VGTFNGVLPSNDVKLVNTVHIGYFRHSATSRVFHFDVARGLQPRYTRLETALAAQLALPS